MSLSHDYFCIETYGAVRRQRSAGRVPDVEFIFRMWNCVKLRLAAEAITPSTWSAIRDEAEKKRRRCAIHAAI